MKKKTKKVIGYSMLIGSTGLIAGRLPEAAAAPVRTVATTGSHFVAPLASVSGAAIVLKQMKKLKTKKVKRRLK